MKVLVAYASKSGSTAGIAEVVGQELRSSGLEADVLDVRSVNDLHEYGAVIIGSAIYFGGWQRAALRFAADHALELRSRPIWLFESGPLDRSAESGKNLPVKAALRLVSELGARGLTTFGGQLEEQHAGLLIRRIMKTGKAGSYGDFRNFDRVRTWARSVAREISSFSEPPTHPTRVEETTRAPRPIQVSVAGGH